MDCHCIISIVPHLQTLSVRQVNFYDGFIVLRKLSQFLVHFFVMVFVRFPSNKNIYSQLGRQLDARRQTEEGMSFNVNEINKTDHLKQGSQKMGKYQFSQPKYSLYQHYVKYEIVYVRHKARLFCNLSKKTTIKGPSKVSSATANWPLHAAQLNSTKPIQVREAAKSKIEQDTQPQCEVYLVNDEKLTNQLSPSLQQINK